MNSRELIDTEISLKPIRLPKPVIPSDSEEFPSRSMPQPRLGGISPRSSSK